MAIEMVAWNEVFKRNHSNRRKDARFGSHHCGSLSLHITTRYSYYLPPFLLFFNRLINCTNTKTASFFPAEPRDWTIPTLG